MMTVMNNSGSELERWLSSGEFFPLNDEQSTDWEPGFDADRQVVRSRLAGWYEKYYLRPDQFNQRFYHDVFPLPIGTWNYQETMQLYEGFCQVSILIELRFQATLTYVQRNPDGLPDINAHIQDTFQCMVTDLVHDAVQNMDEGQWVQSGLNDIEQAIAVSVSERLMTQNVQSRTICKISAKFNEFPQVQPGKDRVYLQVLKQSHDVTEQKNQALFQQYQALKEQKLLHKQEEIKRLEKFGQIERQKRSQEASNRLLLLQDEERQLAELLAIETRIHAEKIKHQQQLKEMEIEAELQTKQKSEAMQRQAEDRSFNENLHHQAQREEEKHKAERERKAKQQLHLSLLHESKVRAEVERYEQQQKIWQEAKLRIYEQQLILEKRQKLLEKEVESEFQAYENERKKNPVVMPFQKLEKSDSSEKMRRRTTELRNEIELSLLEKQRLELDMAIQEFQKNNALLEKD